MVKNSKHYVKVLGIHDLNDESLTMMKIAEAQEANVDRK